MSRLKKLLWLFDKVANERPDEVRRGIDKVARTADRKTGGRYSSKIQRGTRAATKYLDSKGHKRH